MSNARRPIAGAIGAIVATSLLVATAVFAAQTPRSGHWKGLNGIPVSFRVAGGKLRSFKMATECGTYTAASVRVRGGKFTIHAGTATTPFLLHGTFTSHTRADLVWSVGYTSTSPTPPTCLAHDEGSAARRGP